MNKQSNVKPKTVVESRYHKVFNGYPPKFLMIDIKKAGKK